MKKPDISKTEGVSHKTLIFFDTILLWYNYAKFHHCEIYKIDNGINNDINGLKMVLMTKIKVIVLEKMSIIIRITIGKTERNF